MTFHTDKSMLEIRWIWKRWDTWELVEVEDEGGGGIYVIYLGCLVIAWHYL